MGVVLEVREVKALAQKLKASPGDPKTTEELLEKIRPVLEVISTKYPFYLQDDLRQEMALWFLQKIEMIVEKMTSGKYYNVGGLISKCLSGCASDWVRARLREDCRYINMDDENLRQLAAPKTYHKRKIIQELMKLVEAYCRVRFPSEDRAKRASRFLYALLDGRRPSFKTDNLKRFYNGQRDHAKGAYTVVLRMLRVLMEKRVEWERN